MNRPVLWSGLAVAIAAVAVLLLVPAERGAAPEPWLVAQEARLQAQLQHAEPGSDRAFKAQLKLDRLHAWQEGRPQPGFPDEFARILYEMKVPSDRSTPQYEPGYRLRERAKAPRSIVRADKAVTWNDRGPGNVAGRARGIIVDPDDPSGLTWFIASVGGGVWKTDDGGASWRPLTDATPGLAVQSITMDPLDHDVIYAGTGESFFNIDTMNGNGILKSTDRGETWTPLAATLDDPAFNNVSRIICSPDTADVVIASATTGTYKAALYPTSNIFRSTDGGATWTAVHTETGTDTFVRAAHPAGDRRPHRLRRAVRHGLRRGHPQVHRRRPHLGLRQHRHHRLQRPLRAGHLAGQQPVRLRLGPGRVPRRAVGVLERRRHLERDLRRRQRAQLAGRPGLVRQHHRLPPHRRAHRLRGRARAVAADPQQHRQHLARPTRGWPATRSPTRTTTAWRSSSPRAAAGSCWAPTTAASRAPPTGSTGFTMPTDGMVTTQFYGVDKRPGASAYFGGMQDNGTWFSVPTRRPPTPGPSPSAATATRPPGTSTTPRR